eukprot:scaffold10373_cov17-Prasinocladus_malaysianus.AAC.1
MRHHVNAIFISFCIGITRGSRSEDSWDWVRAIYAAEIYNFMSYLPYSTYFSVACHGNVVCLAELQYMLDVSSDITPYYGCQYCSISLVHRVS